jgi:hypothetical protein
MTPAALCDGINSEMGGLAGAQSFHPDLALRGHEDDEVEVRNELWPKGVGTAGNGYRTYEGDSERSFRRRGGALTSVRLSRVGPTM